MIKDKYHYLLAVLVVVSLAFFLDLVSSNVAVEYSNKVTLDSSGEKLITVQASFPLWYQIVGLAKNFLYGLGAAIFITVFIADRMQKALHEEKQQELTKLNEAISVNVFDSLFKTIIPDAIFKIIKQEIIENKVLRKEAKWIYDFTVRGEVIVCRQTTRYELHNLSHQEVSNPIRLDLDALGGAAYSLVSAECHGQFGDVLVKYNPDDDSKHINLDVVRDGNKLTVLYSVKIPAKSYAEYNTVFEKHYKGDITDAQGTKVPVVGADIIVNFPDGYHFDISPLMSTTPRLISESSIQKIYRVEGGVLPNQGFVFYLVKKKEDVDVVVDDREVVISLEMPEV
ncbi:hypothetical protein [Pseudomonas sp.]|uniref:hypothetical protein n=1 Tax=Pseudomonas sp. TaxID=306 RepID=UPI001B118682|nr:hypothetical protein [Pseudomonas sp.]MBO9548928.1 hypothetical protein [Pseudomonas sp.]